MLCVEVKVKYDRYKSGQLVESNAEVHQYQQNVTVMTLKNVDKLVDSLTETVQREIELDGVNEKIVPSAFSIRVKRETEVNNLSVTNVTKELEKAILS